MRSPPTSTSALGSWNALLVLLVIQTLRRTRGWPCLGMKLSRPRRHILPRNAHPTKCHPTRSYCPPQPRPPLPPLPPHPTILAPRSVASSVASSNEVATSSSLISCSSLNIPKEGMDLVRGIFDKKTVLKIKKMPEDSPYIFLHFDKPVNPFQIMILASCVKDAAPEVPVAHIELLLFCEGGLYTLP